MQNIPTAAALSTSFLLSHAPNSPELNALITRFRQLYIAIIVTLVAIIAYFIGNISAKKYQNAFTCVKVIANERWDAF